MIALFDVNVLVALFDPHHVHHRSADDWLAATRQAGWARCRLPRISGPDPLQPDLLGRRTTIEDAVHRLEALRGSGDDNFWPDTVWLFPASSFAFAHVAGHRQLTRSLPARPRG